MGSSSQDSTAKLNTEQFSEAICIEHDLCTMSQQTELSSRANTFLTRPHRRHSEPESSPKISLSSLVSKSTSSTERIDVSPNSFLSLSSTSPCSQIALSSFHKLVVTPTRGVLAKVCTNLLKKTSHMNLGMTIVLMFAILSFNVCHTDARVTGLCRGVPCANGGRLLVSNSIWGDCRCRCPANFVGPYCQYQIASKRSVESEATSVPNRRLNRSETMERIRQRLINLSRRLTAREENRQRESRRESTTNYDNNYLDVEDLNDTQQRRISALRSYRLRRSWYPNDYKR